MKYIGIAVLCAGLVIGAFYFGVQKKFPSLLSQIQQKTKKTDSIAISQLGIQLPEKISTPSGSVAGTSNKVLGIATDLTQKGVSFGKSVSGLFLNTDAATKDSIEVSGVVAQIQQQVESIPSKIVDQAKIAYCQQVLIEATKSATSH